MALTTVLRTNVLHCEIRLKNFTLVSRLSSSLNVIGSDTDRSATYDFLSMSHYNHGPISCRFRENGDFCRK